MAVDPFSEGRRVAVLIGQNEFPNASDLQNLRFSEADIDAVHDLLKADGGTVYDVVHKVPSGDHHVAFTVLDDALHDLRSDDTVIVYYSGHGVVDRRGRLHLAFRNTEDNRLASTSIRIGHVMDLLQSSNASKRLLVLDCCFAGAVGAEFTKSGVADQVQSEVLGTGTVVLTATTDLDVAKEDPAFGHGIFTKHMLDGLSGSADINGDGIITAQELYDYVHARVSAQSPQRPLKFNLNTEGQIALRKTGQTPWLDKAASVRSTVLALSQDGNLSDRILTEALRILKLEPAQMSPATRARFDLLCTIDPETYRPGTFSNQWDALPFDADTTVGPPRDHAPKKPSAPPDTSSTTGKDTSVRLVAGMKEMHDNLGADRGPRHTPGFEEAAAFFSGTGKADAPGNTTATTNTKGTATDAPTAFSFLKWGSKDPVPDWYLNLSVAAYLLVPPMIIADAVNTFATAEEFGVFLLMVAGLGIWQIWSRFGGTARWRKVFYAVLGGIYGLAGFAFLTNVGY